MLAHVAVVIRDYKRETRVLPGRILGKPDPDRLVSVVGEFHDFVALVCELRIDVSAVVRP